MIETQTAESQPDPQALTTQVSLVRAGNTYFYGRYEAGEAAVKPQTISEQRARQIYEANQDVPDENKRVSGSVSFGHPPCKWSVSWFFYKGQI
jgi:hypothetical protein